MRRITLALCAAGLLLAGCDRKPRPPAETRPDWRGAAVGGLAPLMTTGEAQAALDRGGYRQIGCTSDKPPLASPLDSGDAMPCFQVPGAPTSVSLYFLDLVEGRRLAVVNINERFTDASTDAQRLASNQAYAAALQARFGSPFMTSENPGFRILYWRVPGGRPELPDVVSTTVGGFEGANATLTSMWAYGRTAPRPE